MKRKCDEGDVILLVFITFVLSLILGAVIGYKIENVDIKKNAIEHGCAQYNPTTSDFEWVKQ